MTVLDVAMRTLHLLTGAVFAGSVVFFAFGVLRATDRDGVGDAAVRSLAGSLTTVSRTSAVLLLVTGGHMARSYVGGGTQTGSLHLLAGMVVLWLLVTGLVEAGAAKLRGGAAPSDTAFFFVGAALAALLVLVDAGALASGGL